MTVKPRVGWNYRLRNGASVKVLRSFEIPFKDGRSGKRMSMRFFAGLILGTVGERLTWQESGYYSPLGHDHPLDIVSREVT